MGLSHFLFFNYNQLMKEKLRKYLTLFLSTLEISAFTFGGGFVIIPLMRKKFVFKLKMIDDEEMLDLTAIAQSAPGAIAVNASILVGYKIGGVLGALISILATVIPPFVIISVISHFYIAFRDNRYVSLVMGGMIAGVAAVVADLVISMAWDILKRKRLVEILMLIISFILLEFMNLNIIALIFIAGAVGYADYEISRRSHWLHRMGRSR